MERFTKYVRDTAAEMNHVKWPSTEQAVVYTVLVVAISAVVALLLSGFDYVFTGLLDLVI